MADIIIITIIAIAVFFIVRNGLKKLRKGQCCGGCPGCGGGCRSCDSMSGQKKEQI